MAAAASAVVFAGSTAAPAAAECTPRVVDFAGLPAGTFLAEQLATDGIHMSAVAYEGRPNELIVFDSNATGTPDADLEVDLGNLAIIPERVTDANADGLVDAPSDSDFGGTQIYSFDEARTVNRFTIVDLDHGTTATNFAVAYDAAGNVIKRVTMAPGSEAGVQVVEVNAENVRRLEITYLDSAGVTRLDLGCTVPRTGNPETPNQPVQPGPGGGTPPPNTGAVREDVRQPATAAVAGPARCVRRYMTVRFRGTGVRDVTFRLNGRRVARVEANGATRISRRIRARGLRGRGQVAVRVRFLPSTGAADRTLRMPFRICAKAAVQTPKFTG